MYIGGFLPGIQMPGGGLGGVVGQAVGQAVDKPWLMSPTGSINLGGSAAADTLDTGSSDTTDTGFFNPEAFFDKYNDEAKAAAEAQRVWSAEQAQKQMDYQTEMSNTQYQRAAADMQAAGLNPYLLMSGAHSAGTPAGAMASSAAADVYKSNDQLTRDLAILKVAESLLTSVVKLFVK